MCTATYLPFSPTGFILTHSRDEKSIRPSSKLPNEFRIGGQNVLFPQDPQGGGTWIAATAHTTVCLLNGAFTPHQPVPPYRHSRGLVIPHFFGYPSLSAFVASYNFQGIEPFTLLIAEAGRLSELRWNGRRLFTQEKDPNRPHIWSSVTLYTPDIVSKRESWFRRWQEIKNWLPDEIRAFHLSAGETDPENALRMNRQNRYLTVSLTQVIRANNQTEFRYDDLTQSVQTYQTIYPDYATV